MGIFLSNITDFSNHKMVQTISNQDLVETNQKEITTSPQPSSGKMVFYEDFESYTVGQLPGGTWENDQGTPTGPSYMYVDNSGQLPSKCLYMYDQDNALFSGDSINSNFLDETIDEGKMEFTFQVNSYSSADLQPMHFKFTVGLYYYTSNVFTITIIEQSGASTFDLYLGGYFYNGLTSGQDYTIKLYFGDGQIDGYVNGIQRFTDAMYTNQSVNRVYISSSGYMQDTGPQFYIDNIKVYSYEYVFWDTFDTETQNTQPSQWTCTDAPDTSIFRAGSHFPSFSSKYLEVLDNSSSVNPKGAVYFEQPIKRFVLNFDLQVPTTTNADPTVGIEFNFRNISTIVHNFSISKSTGSNNWRIMKDGVNGPSTFNLDTTYHVNMTIVDYRMKIYVGSSLEFDIAAPEYELYSFDIDSNGLGEGNWFLFDNFTIKQLHRLRVQSAYNSPINMGQEYSLVLWTVTDSQTYLNDYIIFRNGTNVEENDVTIGGIRGQPLDTLPAGIWNFTLKVNNSANEVLFDEVLITIINDPPHIVGPADMEYYFGIPGQQVTWNLYDNNTFTRTYCVWKNDTPVMGHFNQTWTNNSAVNVDLTGLAEGYWNYTIEVSDGTGINSTDTVFVNTSINDAPLISTPIDINYAFGSAGNQISWTIWDNSTYGQTYTIYKNETALAGYINLAWTNNSVFNVNINGFMPGVWNITCIALDGIGGSVSDEVIVTVTNDPPSLDHPSDVNYNYGDINQWINWTPTDLSTQNPKYTVFRNGSALVGYIERSWTTGIKINVSVSGLAPGSYNYTIQIDDGSGTNQSDEVIVNVANNPPSISGPIDFSYNFGSTSNVIQWTITDSDTVNRRYSVYRNGTALVGYIGQPWTSGIAFDVNIDGLMPGIYNFTIFADDGSGNNGSDEVIVTVQNSPPSVSDVLNFSYNFGSTSNVIQWTITDSDTTNRRYTVYRNGTALPGYIGQTWTSGVSFNVNIDGLLPGVYNFTIYADDGSGNNGSDQVNVTVQNSPPTFSIAPNDFDYVFGNTSVWINWTAVDSTTLLPKYTVYRNGTAIIGHIGQSWTSGIAINVSISGLQPGSYNFTIQVNDGSGVNVTDEVIVNVINSPPSVEGPNNFEYVYGSSSNTITWIITDANTTVRTYTIYRNNSALSGHIGVVWSSGTPIIINIDGLAPGLYVFNITADDGAHINGTDIVNVTVVNTPPVIIGPEDFTYIFGTSSNSITWTIYDANTTVRTYTIYRNGTALVGYIGMTWTSGSPIVLNIDGLMPVTWNFTITADDGAHINGTDEVLVIVFNTPPVVQGSDDFNYNYGTTNNIITWTAIDANTTTRTYTVYRNGEAVSGYTGQSWTSNVAINVNVDGLLPGMYTFIIQVDDGSHNNGTDTVLIGVVNTPSSINHPGNQSVWYGVQGNRIIWRITDSTVHPSRTYTVYRNNTPVAWHTDQPWTSGVDIEVYLDGLNPGEYNYTIIANDGLGFSISDQLNITVMNLPPTITDLANFNMHVNSTENYLVWNITDASTNNPTYVLYRNGVSIQSGSWTSNVPLKIKIDGLDLGVYNFTIIASEGYIYSVNDSVNVTVMNIKPIINSPPDITYTHNQYPGGLNFFTINWTVDDRSIGPMPTYSIYINEEFYITSNWKDINVIIVNFFDLEPGTHKIKIIVRDGLGLEAEDEVIVKLIASSNAGNNEDDGDTTPNPIINFIMENLIMVVGGTVAVIGSIVGYVVIRKRRQLNYFKVDTPKPTKPTPTKIQKSDVVKPEKDSKPTPPAPKDIPKPAPKSGDGWDKPNEGDGWQ